jgi:hypothetical protein
MAGMVGHLRDQPSMRRSLRPQLIHQAADHFHHLLVGALTRAAVIASATNAIALTQPPPRGRQQQRLHVIFHIKPIAHVGTVSVEGNRLTSHLLENHHRNQLLGELPGAVVVDGNGEQHGQPVGVVQGPHQVIIGGLAGRIGAAQVVGRGF